MPSLTRPDGVTLRWETAGEGSVVLLLHGLSSSARSFRHQMTALARDHRVLALDMRGYGESDDWTTPPALEELVDDVAAVLATEAGAAHVVGSSFGAVIAILLARHYRASVRSLCLASPTLGRGGLPAAARAAWRDARLTAPTGALGAEGRAASLASATAPATVVEQIAESVRRVRRPGYARVVELLSETDAGAWLSELTLPILAIAGGDDRVTGVPVLRRIAEVSPAARTAVVPDAGHAIHLEQPGLFNSALMAFIREVEGEAPLRIGICGTGTIARAVLEGVSLGLAGPARVLAVAGRPGGDEGNRALATRFGCSFTSDPSRLPALGVDVVFEAAGAAAVVEYLESWLEAGADVVLMSSSALADLEFEARTRRALRRYGRRLFVPAGAVGGIDAVSAAALAGLEHVSLRTVKPVGAVEAAAGAGVVFSGSARVGARRFPRNLNVAATLALAAGSDVEVTVEVDPSISRNRHEVVAEGAFGSLRAITENVPSADNPRSSRLAALSALATLRRLREPLVIGA